MKLYIFLLLIINAITQYKISYINETEWIILTQNSLFTKQNQNAKYCYYLNLFCPK
jgi:hypothetical protein